MRLRPSWMVSSTIERLLPSRRGSPPSTRAWLTVTGPSSSVDAGEQLADVRTCTSPSTSAT